MQFYESAARQPHLASMGVIAADKRMRVLLRDDDVDEDG